MGPSSWTGEREEGLGSQGAAHCLSMEVPRQPHLQVQSLLLTPWNELLLKGCEPWRLEPPPAPACSSCQGLVQGFVQGFIQWFVQGFMQRFVQGFVQGLVQGLAQMLLARHSTLVCMEPSSAWSTLCHFSRLEQVV